MDIWDSECYSLRKFLVSGRLWTSHGGGGLERSYEIDMFRDKTHFIVTNGLRGSFWYDSLEQLSLRVPSLEMYVIITSQRRCKAGNLVGSGFPSLVIHVPCFF